MNIQNAIARLVERVDLTADEMCAVMDQIMQGQATGAQIGGFLIALRMKGERVQEIAAAAKTMRACATAVPLGAYGVIDLVGTGGDGLGTFNISTVSALVAAAGGARIAKHGNRAVSGRSGAADFLECAGVKLDLSPERIAAGVDELGFGFMFAANHHSAMRHVVGARRELGVRTLFNVLGPLTNPAGVCDMVLGVYSADLLEPLAQVLSVLGAKRALVVHAGDGMDEISVFAPTQVAELRAGQVERYVLQPSDFGFGSGCIEDILITDAEQSVAMARRVLADTPGVARDLVCLNAGAAFYVFGLCQTLAEGVQRAADVIASGAADAKLAQLVEFSNADV